MRRINRINKMMNKEKIKKLRLEVSSFIREHGIDFLLSIDLISDSKLNGIYVRHPIHLDYIYYDYVSQAKIGKVSSYHKHGITIFRRKVLRICCDNYCNRGYKFLDFILVNNEDNTCYSYYINLNEISVTNFLENIYRFSRIREYA